MFGIIPLLVCLLSGDPDESRPPVGLSNLTPRVVAPIPNHAGEAVATGEARRVSYLLRWWESVSSEHAERSAAARQNLRMNVATELNGHAALAVEKLTGLVRADDLSEQFSWILVEDSNDRVCLEARPKDATEQLFYDSIRVWLDPKTCQLSKLQTTDRRGRVFTSWLSVERAVESNFVKVAFVPPQNDSSDLIPPAPSAPDPKRSEGVVQTTATSSFVPLRGFKLYVDETDDPADLSEVTPRLSAILLQWEQSSTELQTATIRFHLTVKNKLVAIEKHSDGELFYQAPDQFKLAMKRPTVRATGQLPRNLRLEPNRAETWIATSESLMAINDDEKSFEFWTNGEKGGTSPESRWNTITHRFVESRFPPFLVDVKANPLRRAWTLQLLETEVIDSPLLITATPRTSIGKALYSQCIIKLDPRTYQVAAIQCFDPTGNTETTYSVIDTNRNPSLPADCFKPDLKIRGYRLVTPAFAK